VAIIRRRRTPSWPRPPATIRCSGATGGPLDESV